MRIESNDLFYIAGWARRKFKLSFATLFLFIIRSGPLTVLNVITKLFCISFSCSFYSIMPNTHTHKWANSQVSWNRNRWLSHIHASCRFVLSWCWNLGRWPKSEPAATAITVSSFSFITLYEVIAQETIPVWISALRQRQLSIQKRIRSRLCNKKKLDPKENRFVSYPRVLWQRATMRSACASTTCASSTCALWKNCKIMLYCCHNVRNNIDINSFRNLKMSTTKFFDISFGLLKT